MISIKYSTDQGGERFSLLRLSLEEIALPEEIPATKKIRELLKEYEQKGLNPLNVLRLAHLTKVSESTQKTISPFTEKNKNIFKKENDRIQQASKWLTRGLVGTTILTCVPFLGIIPDVSNWATASPINNVRLLTAFLGIAAVVNVVNFIATGTIPNIQTSATEQARLARLDIKATMRDLSRELEIINKLGLTEAQIIAQALDVDEIAKCMLSSMPSNEYKIEIDECCYKLKIAQSKVLGCKQLQGPFLANSTEIKFNDTYDTV